MDCDRIVVMSDGVAVEMGSPLELLQRPQGIFAHMARGDASAAALLQARGLALAPEEAGDVGGGASKRGSVLADIAEEGGGVKESVV